PRHGAGMARHTADGPVGLLSHARRHRTEDRDEDALVKTPALVWGRRPCIETARLVVGEPPSYVAVPDRVSFRALRLQRGAVLSELHRGSGRAVGAAGSPSGGPRPTPAASAACGRLGPRQRGDGRPGRLRRVGAANAVIVAPL